MLAFMETAIDGSPRDTDGISQQFCALLFACALAVAYRPLNEAETAARDQALDRGLAWLNAQAFAWGDGTRTASENQFSRMFH